MGKEHIQVIVPKDLKRRFKVAVAMNGTDMSKPIIRFMEEYVEGVESDSRFGP